jgi:hypothetical protein
MNCLQKFADGLTSLNLSETANSLEKNISAQALFSALLQNEIRVQIDSVTWQHMDGVIGQYFEAVLLCRESKLASARAQLELSDTMVPGLEGIVLDFVTLYKLSAWGNYYYKTKEAAKAISLLHQGLTISAKLERKGYHPLIYRRIEQIQNIANIYFKQQDHDSGNKLLNNAIRFVHSGVAEGLLIDDWDTSILNRVHALQEITFRGLISQLVNRNSAYMNDRIYDNAYYYKFFFQELLQELETNTYVRLVSYNWLYVKASYFTQGLDAFCSNSLEFISDPYVSATYDEFKANLLVQTIHCIKNNKTLQNSREMIDRITSFAKLHLNQGATKIIEAAV